MKLKEYCSENRQPGAIFTITQNLHHVRQCLRSLSQDKLNQFKWNINMNAIVKCYKRTSFIFGTFNEKCASLIKGNICDEIKFNESQALSSVIEQTIVTSNVNFGVLCNTYIDINKGTFPSNEGIKCMLFFKRSQINNINRNNNTNNIIDKKIKYKFIFDDVDWNLNRIVQMKIQSLSHYLSRLIIINHKIVLGCTWTGAWYVAKKRVKSTKECLISFNGTCPEVKRVITKYEMYITYEYDKPLPTIEEMINVTNPEQRQHDFLIGASAFSNLFSIERGHDQGLELYSLMTLPKEQLQKYGKVEDSKSKYRRKFWNKPWDYFYGGKADKEYLGDCFSLAMNVANGVRLRSSHVLPEPIIRLQAALIESKIINQPADAVAVNLYYNDTNKDISSGIDSHNEADRFSALTHCTFTSGHSSANTVLSINQSKLHGTAEVNIPSVNLEIVQFDSLAFSLLHTQMVTFLLMM